MGSKGRHNEPGRRKKNDNNVIVELAQTTPLHWTNEPFPSSPTGPVRAVQVRIWREIRWFGHCPNSKLQQAGWQIIFLQDNDLLTTWDSKNKKYLTWVNVLFIEHLNLNVYFRGDYNCRYVLLYLSFINVPYIADNQISITTTTT